MLLDVLHFRCLIATSILIFAKDIQEWALISTRLLCLTLVFAALEDASVAPRVRATPARSCHCLALVVIGGRWHNTVLKTTATLVADIVFVTIAVATSINMLVIIEVLLDGIIGSSVAAIIVILVIIGSSGLRVANHHWLMVDEGDTAVLDRLW